MIRLFASLFLLIGLAAAPTVVAAAELPAKSSEILVPYRDEQGHIVARKPSADAPPAEAESPQDSAAAPGEVDPPQQPAMPKGHPGKRKTTK
jgi:hypothetical protein